MISVPDPAPVLEYQSPKLFRAGKIALRGLTIIGAFFLFAGVAFLIGFIAGFILDSLRFPGILVLLLIPAFLILVGLADLFGARAVRAGRLSVIPGLYLLIVLKSLAVTALLTWGAAKSWQDEYYLDEFPIYSLLFVVCNLIFVAGMIALAVELRRIRKNPPPPNPS